MAENPFNEVVIYPALDFAGHCENCGSELVAPVDQKKPDFVGTFSDAAILAALEDEPDF